MTKYHPTSSFVGSIIIYCATAAIYVASIKKRKNKEAFNTATEGESGGTTGAFDVPVGLLSRTDGKYNDEIKLAVKLALEAGNNMTPHLQNKGTINEISQSTLGISYKTTSSDFCTEIDLKNETLVANGIRAAFPSHVIIGEESTGTADPSPLAPDEPTWIIDPIDGTTNFAAGLPLTCVSIGFCEGGRPVLGVVFSPPTGELYAAVEGRGAYRNGKRLVKSSGDGAVTDVSLSRAVVCFEFGYECGEEGIEKMVAAVKRILKHGCRCLRGLGSGVLDLCYVASGRLDVVYAGVAGEGWKPWDYCAGMVIVEEAGGVIRSLQGQKEEFDDNGVIVPGSRFDIYSKSVICGGNKKLLEDCRRLVLDLPPCGK
eukprot:CAMPEP_0172512074 /NCGR_PEP_ID=MMETSP1066-20121228/241533_1 /TAXON_ID=671091 /ORGANISM="Coscinodiscus wailesii, Strain CCMP2513" /LENGTH=370 /DNA_ID=CAMNT_0013291711 /DNA_START=28 /DNA_END=1140 /DNA_ORIENTATION=+